MKRTTSLLLGLTLGGCTVQPAPVPVSGDLQRLVGRWAGSYESAETGRSGTIVFTLASVADTARGDVIMLPRGAESPLRRAAPLSATDREPPASEVLTIRFVRLDGDTIRGTLDPYRDPTCGCVLYTVFEGHLEGTVIRGTFSSRHSGDGRVSRGTWGVSRG